jgi:hypothetical protein
MAGVTLAELLMRPVMPEEYDRGGEPPIMPHARAFGAGVADPMGLPSWLYNRLAGDTINSRWYKDRMQEARDESPMAAGAGSAVLPALLAGPLVGGPLLGAGSVGEAMTIVPPIIGIGGALGRMKGAMYPSPQQPASDSWTPEVGLENWAHNLQMRPRARRPQAGYPPGGAY